MVLSPFDFTRVVYNENGALRTADVVAFAPGEHGLDVLLIVRGSEPFLGHYAVPGGFLEKGQDAGPGVAAVRELQEETGLIVDAPLAGFEECAPATLERGRLAWLNVYDAPGRDPRFSTASDGYIVVLDHKPHVEGADDAAHAEFVPFDALMKRVDSGEHVLAFDHDQYLRDARDLLRRFDVSSPA
jgi:8-oxo-dGTP diphosphatase